MDAGCTGALGEHEVDGDGRGGRSSGGAYHCAVVAVSARGRLLEHGKERCVIQVDAECIDA